MILIEGGTFKMGSEFGEFEKPVHAVTISDFYLDSAPVSNAAFAQFVAATNYLTRAEKQGAALGYQNGQYKQVPGLHWRTYATPERQSHPVVLVSWHDAQAYAQWAGKRLPSEAEWEYVARDGKEQMLYAWGNEEPNGTQCNFAQSPQDLPPTKPVDFYPPNSLGIYDMVGNVWQWCNDWYEGEYYAHSPELNPQGPLEGKLKVRRGGSFNVIQSFRLRCANRGAMLPYSAVPNVGFRCAKSL